jgi:hypothetical protein
MNSFLITYKPSSENPDLGWPDEELQALVKRKCLAGTLREPWRFLNRKDISIGDRVFLLLQGRGGPSIFGYGRVAADPTNASGRWTALVEFDDILDPNKLVFLDKDDLRSIEGARTLWRTRASGIRIPEPIANVLGSLVVGKSAKSRNTQRESNPDWLRDELILALNVYLKHRPNPPAKESPEIIALSDTLNRLGKELFPPEQRASTFRNTNGVYMKLMNFRRLDPQYICGWQDRVAKRSEGRGSSMGGVFGRSRVLSSSR